MRKYISLGIIIIALLGLVLLFGTDQPAGMSEKRGTPVVVVDDVRVRVDIADTVALRTEGLSGKKLFPGEGMLFLFPRESKYSFWMKDMLISIDIIWISEDLKVVDVHQDVSPETFPETFSPKEPARYVLEVPAGFFKKHDLEIGDSVSFENI